MRTLLERQREQILADCQAEIRKHEFQADYDRGSSQKLNETIESQREEICRAHQGDERRRQDQQLLHEQLLKQNWDLREAHEKSLSEMERLKRFQGSTFDTIARKKLVEDQDTILELTGKIQELQNEINCMNDSRDFQDAESVRSGHSHVTTQPVSFPPHRSSSWWKAKPFFWNAEPQKWAAKHLGHTWFFGKHKFPKPTTFACWKIRFKTEVCTCSQFATEVMLWIKEVEMVDSVDDLKSSLSVGGNRMPDFEVLDAKIASALNRIIHNTQFKRKVSLEAQKAKKRTVSFAEDRSIPDLRVFLGHWSQRFRRELCRPIYCRSSK